MFRTSFLFTLDKKGYMWYKYWHNLVENSEASPSFISILLIFIEGASITLASQVIKNLTRRKTIGFTYL